MIFIKSGTEIDAKIKADCLLQIVKIRVVAVVAVEVVIQLKIGVAAFSQ